MGKMTPPRLEPVAKIPNAAPRRLLNHPEIVFRAQTRLAVGVPFLPQLLSRLTRLEDGGYANRTAHALCKQDLVVLVRDGCHH